MFSPQSNSAAPVVAFDKRNRISLVGKVPGSFLAALIACLNVEHNTQLPHSLQGGKELICSVEYHYSCRTVIRYNLCWQSMSSKELSKFCDNSWVSL